MRPALRLLPLALLAGCSLFAKPPQPPPAVAVHYLVGAPYQLGGVWRYPRAEYGVDETGLATIAADHTGLTADGEVFDQGVLAAGHRTLQLPAIVRVTNLENGRQIVLRLNDRGPATPSRLISLTRRAAELLQARDGARIRLQMQDTETRQLAAELDSSGPSLAMASVPRASVQSESLAPPGGASPSARGRVASAGASPTAAASIAPTSTIPLRLPEAVTQGFANPGQLYVDCGYFSRQDYASIMLGRLASLGARLTTSYNAPRDRAYRVRIGPFATVPEAEAMQNRAISAGVNDAAIVIE